MGTPFEDKTILAVWMPSMETGVKVVNEIECAHLLRQVLPHGLQSDAYWFLFKNDSWLKQNLREHFPYLNTLPNRW